MHSYKFSNVKRELKHCLNLVRSHLAFQLYKVEGQLKSKRKLSTTIFSISRIYLFFKLINMYLRFLSKCILFVSISAPTSELVVARYRGFPIEN